MSQGMQRSVELSIDGQRFRHHGSTTIPNGTAQVAILSSHCADCGCRFTTYTMGRSFLSAAIPRRCAAHRAAGMRVIKLHPRARGGAAGGPPSCAASQAGVQSGGAHLHGAASEPVLGGDHG